jgi:hypothetical protein
MEDRHPGAALREVLKRLFAEVSKGKLSLIAAGIAFYGIFSLVPVITALVSLYGLVFDPAAVAVQGEAVSGIVPKEALDLVSARHRLGADLDQVESPVPNIVIPAKAEIQRPPGTSLAPSLSRGQARGPRFRVACAGMTQKKRMYLDGSRRLHGMAEATLAAKHRIGRAAGVLDGRGGRRPISDRRGPTCSTAR